MNEPHVAVKLRGESAISRDDAKSFEESKQSGH
jgi:hypothetical protein